MWTEFSIACSAIACLISLVAALSGVRTAARLRALQDQLLRLPVSKLESLAASQQELADTMEQLANRVKMQRVRTAANHVKDDGAPDPHKDPERWRAWMNGRIARSKVGG